MRKQSKAELEKARIEFETAQRSGDLTRMSELQYAQIPELEKQLASSFNAKKEMRLNYYAIK